MGKRKKGVLCGMTCLVNRQCSRDNKSWKHIITSEELNCKFPNFVVAHFCVGSEYKRKKNMHSLVSWGIFQREMRNEK